MSDDQGKRGATDAPPLGAEEARDLDALIGGAAPPPAATGFAPVPPVGAGAPPTGLPSAYATLPPNAAVSDGGPGWGVAVAALVIGAALGAGATFFAMPSAPPPTVTSAAPAASSAEPEPTPPPPEPSPVERAAVGDEAAMKSIADRPMAERSVEESVALARGERARKVAEIRKLAEALAKSPDLASDPAMLSRLRQDAKDPDIAFDVLHILANVPGPGGVDVLYDVWIGTRGKTPVTELAEQLVFSKEVRPRASEALAVALDLRVTEECEAVSKVVDRAVEHGDVRSLALLGRLMSPYGCGARKNEDCYPCLRLGGQPKGHLKNSLKETRKRPAPRF